MYSDAIYSHYEWVKSRLLANNPQRVVAGLLDAQDWPSKPFKFDAFYLLDLDDTPVGKQGYSASTPIVLKQVQWVWINKGTDLKQGERQANRGDRFILNQTMKGELLNATFPRFTEKLSWSLDVNGNWTGTSKTPQEFITWTPVEFHKRSDKDSGITYGAAALRIQDMTDTITS